MAETDFGTDVAGSTDVDPEGKMATGRQLLGEALVRRYLTPRGRLIDDPNYGEDLTEHINDDMSPTDLAAMQSAAAQEALKDERVLAADAVATLDLSGLCTLTITITDGDGPFKLVLAVSAVTVALLTVTQ